MILEEKRVRCNEKQAGEVGMGQVFHGKPSAKRSLEFLEREALHNNSVE